MSNFVFSTEWDAPTLLFNIHHVVVPSSCVFPMQEELAFNFLGHPGIGWIQNGNYHWLKDQVAETAALRKPPPACLQRLSAALGKRYLPPHARAFPTATASLPLRGRQPVENRSETPHSEPILRTIARPSFHS